jgi:DNA polymerase-3 subunit alpha
MQYTFIHLDVHTEYSISDGLCRIEELLETTARQQMPAIAINDKNNLFAAIKFYQEACKTGIKPLLSAEVLVSYGDQRVTRLILFCKNRQGYRHLSHLLSKAYQQQQAQVLVSRDWLTEAAEGLIAIGGGYASDIGQALLNDQHTKAAQYAAEWEKIFPGNFYLQISRIGREQEEVYIQRLVKLAAEKKLPVVATNEVRFIEADDYIAHEARVAIYAGYTLEDPKRPQNYTAQQYLRTPTEMHTLFADLPETLQNTVELAKRCNMQFALGEYHLPNFPLPEQQTAEDYLAECAALGLQQRLQLFAVNFTAAQKAAYAERLQIELKVINAMGFASYFLIVADFIQWAKLQDIPVGPGRGSGAGSLVAYSLGITDLDPLQYDLLFERFLNPERVSLPDFDIDFCMERRDEVIEYVAQRYGRDKVAQIITYGTMAAKAVIRDVGRVLAYPYGFVDKLAKLIPFEIGMTLEKALIDSDLLRMRYEQEEEVKELINLALKLEGIARNAGKHAGGVVIAPRALSDFVPLYCELENDQENSSIVTQFDKDDIETIGLVKFDFLGLRTLTIIHWACITINALQKSETVRIDRIPLNDKETFKLLQQCKTTAVFQLESRGMKELIKRLQPDCFEDIIALVALFRPGPLQSGMVDDFINRKHGRDKATYFHPLLEPILRPTYGVILYQEQVMQIAQVLAGYTLGSADLLRRAMGKKKPEEMAKQREIFVQGAKANNIDGQLATTIFDLMEKFAGYGFNKSHSAAYALLAYQTAWLKTHYPAAFMAAVLSSDMDNTDKVVNFIEDCRAIKVPVMKPDINRAEYKFTADGDNIIYGLGAIKGAGEAAIEVIVNERHANGNFTGLFNLCQRMDSRKVNRRVLEALIRGGALDCFAVDRATLLASLDDALKMAEQKNQNQLLGQVDLFHNEAENLPSAEHYTQVAPWSLIERLNGEKSTLGFYCTGHPLDTVVHELKQLLPTTLIQLRPEPKRNQWMAGLVFNIRVVKTKQGKQMQIITLEDKTTRMDIVLFPDDAELYREVLTKDSIVFVEGEVLTDDYSGGLRVRAKKVLSFAQARAHCAKGIHLHLAELGISEHFVQQLAGWLQPHVPGACPIDIHYQHNGDEATMRLGPAWWVQATDELIHILTSKLGPDAVKIDYRQLC